MKLYAGACLVIFLFWGTVHFGWGRTEPSQQLARETGSDYYQQWLKEDVLWIISEAEKTVFNLLTTPEEKDVFIEQFWFRRDPDPSTFHNEYKEEHYRRIAYANEHFTAGIDGWKSDRGMIYIKFGPPDRIETYPAGGQYVRRRKEGGGLTSIFPTIRWEYRYIEGVGQDIELEFVDDEGGGLFELTFDNQRKDELLLTGNAGPTMDELEREYFGGEGHRQERVARRRYSGDGAGPTGAATSFETYRDKPFETLELAGRLNRPVAIRFKDLEAAISTRITYTQLPFDVRTDYVRLSPQQMMALVTVLIPNENLSFAKIDGVYRADAQIFGRITQLSGRVVNLFEDDLRREYYDDELDGARNRASVYQKQLLVRPGIYKLEVGIRDVQSRKLGTSEIRLEAPTVGSERLALSSMIMAQRIEAASADPMIKGFLIGDLKVVPRNHEEYRSSESLGFYLQIYNFGIDQQTGRPALKVHYSLVERGVEPQGWRDISRLAHFAGQYCRLARILTLSHLGHGDYELRVRVEDPLTGQSVASISAFRIIS